MVVLQAKFCPEVCCSCIICWLHVKPVGLIRSKEYMDTWRSFIHVRCELRPRVGISACMATRGSFTSWSDYLNSLWNGTHGGGPYFLAWTLRCLMAKRIMFLCHSSMLMCSSVLITLLHTVLPVITSLGRDHGGITVNSYSASHDNWCTVGGNGGCRVGEVQAGTTSPMPDHKGFKLQ